MRYIIIIWIILTSFQELKSQPKIFINDRAVANLGVLPPTILDTALFIFNKGKSELKISSLAASCSCASVKIDKECIFPGDSAKLFFRIDLFSASGSREYHIIVNSNDGLNSKLDIPIKLYVDRDLVSNPKRLPFKPNLHVGDTIIYKLTLTNTGNKEIEIGVPFSSNAEHFIVLSSEPFEERTIPKGSSRTFTVSIKLLNEKLSSSDLEIPTTSTLLPILKYSVMTATDLRKTK